jgi:hypothetical protein
LSVKVAASESVPKAMQATYDEIVGITDAFCAKHLNEEYAGLCRRMTAKLTRKRPSPLLSGGRAISWAGAVVYALGKVNFLFDKSQKPHLKASELCALLGVSEQNASSKAKFILDLLKIMQLDPMWCLPSKLAENPMAWMISVNGFIVDVRQAPREIQEEAYRRGMIPFLPEAADG